MLQLSDTLMNQPILSLRTGTEVATLIRPIINPHNLKIEAFWCQDSMNRKRELILLPQDIRDALPQGLVINDHDALVEPKDLVRLQTVISLGFELIGKPVRTTSKEKLGKIEDYATDIPSMFIQKMYVSQSLLKNFSGGNLGIDRNQIVEITDREVIVNDLDAKVPANARAMA
jgi:sporulation protein YlmC with PRC-barrel domain